MECYEESMPIKPINDDYLRYYIDEAMSPQDRINYIIKKGSGNQKEHLLSTLYLYISSESLLNYIISTVCPIIDIWEESVQKTFPSNLSKLVNEMISMGQLHDNQGVIASILLHMMKSILSSEETITHEYVINYNFIISALSDGNQLSIPEDIIDYVISIGRLGQNNKRSMYCAFFCSSLIRVSNGETKDLFSRINDLHYYNDKTVLYQITNDLDLLIKDVHDDQLLKDVFGLTLDLLDDNSDVIILINCLCSLLNNWKKTIQKFSNNDNKVIQHIIHKIAFVFSNSEYTSENDTNSNSNNTRIEFELLTNLYSSLISLLGDNRPEIEIDIEVDEFSLFKKTEILQLFLNNYYFTNSPHSKIKLEVYIKLLAKELKAIKYVTDDNIVYQNRFCHKLFMLIKTSSSPTEKDLFYNQLYMSVSLISNSILISIVNEIDVSVFLNKNCLTNTISALNAKSNENHFIAFLDKLSKYDLTYVSNHNLPFVFQGLTYLVKCIMSKDKVTKKEEFYRKFVSKSKFILNLSKGFQIDSSIIPFFIAIIKHSVNRDDLLTYCFSFGTNTSFFKRRLFHIFIQESFGTFSFNFIYEKYIWKRYLSLLSTSKCPIELCSLLNILTSEVLSLVITDNHFRKVIDHLQALTFTDIELVKKLASVYCRIDQHDSFKDTHEYQCYLEEDKRRHQEEIEISNKELLVSFNGYYKERLKFKPKMKTVRNRNALLPAITQGNKTIILTERQISHANDLFGHAKTVIYSKDRDLASSLSNPLLRRIVDKPINKNRNMLRSSLLNENSSSQSLSPIKNQRTSLNRKKTVMFNIENQSTVSINNDLNTSKSLPKIQKKKSRLVFPKLNMLIPK